jgi:hypothetical protein
VAAPARRAAAAPAAQAAAARLADGRNSVGAELGRSS